VAAIGAADGRTHAEAALGEVEAVANLATDAVVGNPFDEGGIDAALQDEVFDQAADGVLGQGGGDGSAQAKAAAQAASHVVFAAALPGLKVAGGVDAALAGIKTEHDLAQAQAIQRRGKSGMRSFSIVFQELSILL